MKALSKDFQKAVKRLEEALALKKDEFTRDSAIMRFQLCFDLTWKTIKAYAKEEGVECFSPKSCFKTAFQLGLIEYDQRWLAMIDDRNLIAHTYAEDTAEDVHSRLKDYLELLKKLSTKLLSTASP